MLTFPTSTLFIEGPDCSGKTSLIKQIHKDTAYAWHIMDRSQFSRKVFCDLYGRNINMSENELHLEMSNLNNRYIFLMPSFNIIKKRFDKRGDDIHDVDSLNDVHRVYGKAVERIRGFPNVCIFYGAESVKKLSGRACAITQLNETSQLREISDQVFNFVRVAGGESYPLQFTLYDDGKFEEADAAILDHVSEGDYYNKIFYSLHSKIENEMDGKNEYSRKEDITSRRFVYSDNTCISFIQIAVRDRLMDFNAVIRSTDVKNIFPSDLKFLYYLASTCYDRFRKCSDRIRMRFHLNSAHIIR